jgi:hypothetical protein
VDKPLPPATTAATASAPTGYTVATSGSALSSDGTVTSGSALCPAGTVVWGGGVYVSSSSPEASVQNSYPNVTTKKSWNASVVNFSGSDTWFTVYAVCAQQPAGYKIVKKAVPNPGYLQSGGLATCPAASVVLGGGGSTSSRSTGPTMNATYPYRVNDVFGWVTDMNNFALANATLTVYAICAKPAPAGYALVYAPSDVSNPSGSQTPGSVSCPAGRVPIGGGAYSNSKSPYVDLNTTYPTSSGWTVFENNTSGYGAIITPVVVCM